MSRASLRTAVVLSFVCAVAASVASVPAVAQSDFQATLRSYNEVPSINSTARAHLTLSISPDDSSISWSMTIVKVPGGITQSHIHFAQTGVNGGIVIFFCSNLGNGPADTQACPTNLPATISGTITAADVLSVTGQGMHAGDLNSVLRAIRAGNAYANIHSVAFPGGELRGQLTQ